MTNPQAIQRAIEQLVASSKINRENIENGKATSTHLRDEIQIASLELERATYSLQAHTSEKENLVLSRKAISEDDCGFLNASIETISQHVKDHQTDEALALSGKLEKNVTLLRKRLQYIAALEQLVYEYAQEKQLRAKLKAVAEVLGLDVNGEEKPIKFIPAEEDQAFTIPVLDAYPPDEPAFNPTLH